MRDAFNATALDLAPAGVDGRTGHGVLRADSVLAYTGATPQPLVRAQQPDVTPVTGDGDAYLEPGETAHAAAAGDQRRRRHRDRRQRHGHDRRPQAMVTPRRAAYGDMAAGATRRAGLPARARAGYPLGKRVRLAVRVTFAGVLSPTTRDVDGADRPAGGDAVKRSPTPGRRWRSRTRARSGASVTIPVSGVGYAAKLTFSIDGATCTTTTRRRRRSGSTTRSWPT